MVKLDMCLLNTDAPGGQQNQNMYEYDLNL